MAGQKDWFKATASVTPYSSPHCHSCGYHVTREGEYGRQCPECEAYLRAHNHSIINLASAVECARLKLGLTREMTLHLLEAFMGMNPEVQHAAMDGLDFYSLVPEGEVEGVEARD